ncbi:unnamed protein product [Polarella glacialis]|uniref:Xanthine dehydrogenase n=1 Tax=Polarella glacialis TaxID=89957 RepID=A0A813FHN6_POLGL|nr:unnamed protein product [Polarella glacialis]
MPSVAVLTAPSWPVLCEPGTTCTASWAVCNDGTEAWPAGCTLRLRGEDNGTEVVEHAPAAHDQASVVACIADGVPTGRVVEVGFEMCAPADEGMLVQSFVFTTPDGEVFGGPIVLNMCIRHAASGPPQQQAVSRPRPHPHLGLFPGSHTRNVYLRRKLEIDSPDCDMSATPLQPPVVLTGKTTQFVAVEDDWSLVSGLEQAPPALVPPQVPDAVVAHFGSLEAPKLHFQVNGQRQVIAQGQFPLSMSLAEYLRYQMGLTGTKIGCGEGGCGACTVALRYGNATSFLTANACLRPLHAMNRMEVITIEQVGSEAKPHPIQKAIAKHSGSQCGMCTPGMVMSIYTHLAKGGDLEKDVESCIQGNLCRCTGYRPIHDAIREVFAAGTCKEDVGSETCQGAVPFNPKALFRQNGQLWFSCSELGDVFVALRQYSAMPHRLVVGSTSTGVVKYYPPHESDKPQVFIDINNVPDLHTVESGKSALTIGAASSLSVLIANLEALTASIPQLAAIVRHLRLVAHPQVRDVASWAGNVMLAKTHPDYPSDVCLLLALLKAKLTLLDASGSREEVEIVPFLLDASLPRKETQAQIIYSVTIPYPEPGTFLETFKIMRRHSNAHAELNAGVMLQFADPASVSIVSARIVFGNIKRGGPFVAEETCKFLVGKTLTSETLAAARLVLKGEVAANIMDASVPDPPFAEVDKEYRQTLAVNLCYKAALRAMASRQGPASLNDVERSALDDFERPASHGQQSFSVDESTAPVGQPVEKYQALDQACGSALFTADTPLQRGTLFGVPVLADRIGTVCCIDISACLGTVGVHSFISMEDVLAVGAKNDIAGFPYKIFASTSEPTQYVGQFVGMVLADSFEAARLGGLKVQVTYGVIEEHPVVSISDALDRGAVFDRYDPVLVGAGHPAPVSESTATVEGKLASSGQRHFYLETQTTYARPDGQGGLEVTSACQVFDWAHTMLTKTLQLPASKISVRNVRIGGAYGGKALMFAPACMAACIGALSAKRPVLVQLDRTPDFLSMGGRAPFEASWKVSFDRTSGKISGLTQDVNQNVGASIRGASQPTSLNCYNIPGAQLQSHSVITNTPVNTWMRAPGEFEGAVIMEASMEQVARTTGLDPVSVQEANLVPGMRKVWDALKMQVGYSAKREAIRKFNAGSRYHKKGMYCMGSKYVCDPGMFKEKCSVRVNHDGSASLEHSGLEVGQGMDTKVVQACTMELKKLAADFLIENVQIVLPKSTSSFSWTGVTGTFGSLTSEAVVDAVLDACQKLRTELEPFAKNGTSWVTLVAAALAAGADLSQSGETKLKKAGPGSSYELFSAGCAQVQVDILTGETQVLSFDVVYDCGKSLNPAVDIGQIEGCIVQALGFSLLEEERRSPVDGRMVNCGTWDYKVPSGQDIPIQMNVTLLPAGQDDTAPVLGSKASGEPAYLCGGATFFAVKDAVGAAREELGLSRDFRLDPPASPDRVLAACGTQAPKKAET